MIESLLISDPWFYAAAVPAVLLLGLSKSGFGAGFASLATPLMALAVPVPQAAAIMLPLLLAADVHSVSALLKHRDRSLIRLLVLPGLLGAGVGFLLFDVLSAATVAGIVGALTLLFLAQRLLFPPRPDAPPPPRWVGAVLAVASGFSSFVAHAGGPPLNVYVLPLKLPQVRFAATMAVFFAILNAAKWVPYAWLGLIDWRNMATGLVLTPLAVLGVWIGLRLTHRVRPQVFYALVYAGMLFTGIKLLWDGFA